MTASTPLDKVLAVLSILHNYYSELTCLMKGTHFIPSAWMINVTACRKIKHGGQNPLGREQGKLLNTYAKRELGKKV